MIINIFFLIGVITTVNTEEQTFCSTCIKNEIDNTCYNVTFLFDINPIIFKNTIVINKLGILKSNTLFFNFEPPIEHYEYSQIGFINLTQAEGADEPVNPVALSGGKQHLNFGPFDLDQDNSLVYIGGSDGIYVLDTKVNRVTPFSSIGDKVISIFYKGNLYFIRDREFKIIRKSGDNFDILVDFMPVYNFVINKYNVIVFLGRDGLFAIDRKEIVRLSVNRFFRGLVIDGDNNVYAWWLDEIYRVVFKPKFTESVLEKVLQVPNLGAMTFDGNNNIVITIENSVYRLNKMSNGTIC